MTREEIIQYWVSSSDLDLEAAEQYINKIKEFRIWLLEKIKT